MGLIRFELTSKVSDGRSTRPRPAKLSSPNRDCDPPKGRSVGGCDSHGDAIDDAIARLREIVMAEEREQYVTVTRGGFYPPKEPHA
jgi:hypothetical protein